jgi:hypothetical protein
MSKPPLRIGRTLLLGSAAALVAGGLFAPQVTAQTGGGGVEINATVTNSTSTGPIIECAWALPDPSARWSDLMASYKTPTGVTANDDTPNQKPATPPCNNPNIGSESKPLQANQPNAASAPVHISVMPNQNDEPNERYIELWAAVDSTAPGTIVHWKVFHPDGSFKVQVDGTNYTAGSSQAPCAGPNGMFDMAVRTGQIEAPAASNATSNIHDSLQDWCRQNVKDFYYGAFGLSKHQPHGKYRIEATAIKPANNGEQTLVYYIEVLPVRYLAKDFNGIGFTNLRAGNVYSIDGDLNFAPGTGPTLQNQGNAGLSVEMNYTNLCILVGNPSVRDCGPGKEITYFDGGLGTSINTVEHREPIPGYPTDAAAASGDRANFLEPIDTTFGPRYRTLCPNDLAKIDFSAHTPQTLQNGSYGGKVHLTVIPSAECPTDKGSVYGPPFDDPNVTVLTDYDGTTPKASGYYNVS